MSVSPEIDGNKTVQAVTVVHSNGTCKRFYCGNNIGERYCEYRKFIPERITKHQKGNRG